MTHTAFRDDVKRVTRLILPDNVLSVFKPHLLEGVDNFQDRGSREVVDDGDTNK